MNGNRFLKTYSQKLGSILILLFGLAGCSNTPVGVNYYRLAFNNPALQVIPTPQNENLCQFVLLEQIEMASFLQNDGLVMQTSQHGLQISDNHRWAEPLEDALSRYVIMQLEQQLPNVRFENLSSRWKKTPDLRLNIQINEFQVSDSKQSVVSGQFWIMDGGRRLITKQRFSFRRDLVKAGYSGALEKLDESLQEAVAQVAGVIASSDCQK